MSDNDDLCRHAIIHYAPFSELDHAAGKGDRYDSHLLPVGKAAAC